MRVRDPADTPESAAEALAVDVDATLIAADSWRAVDLGTLGGLAFGRPQPVARFAGMVKLAENDNRAATPAGQGTPAAEPVAEPETERRLRLAKRLHRRDAAPDLAREASDREVEALAAELSALDLDPVSNGAAFVGAPAAGSPSAEHPAYQPMRVQPLPLPPPINWQAPRRRAGLDRSALNSLIVLMILIWAGAIGSIFYLGNQPTSGFKITTRKD